MDADALLIDRIERRFPLRSELDSFCLLNFPEIHAQLPPEMTRSEQIRFLVATADRVLLLRILDAQDAATRENNLTASTNTTLGQGSTLSALLDWWTGRDATERAFSQLELGWLLCEAPSPMLIYRPAVVSVSAIRSLLDEILRAQTAKERMVRKETLFLGRRLRVELTADEPEDFDIYPLTITEQPVAKDEVTLWEWRVTPKVAGDEKTLRILVTNLVQADGDWVGKSLPARTLSICVAGGSPQGVLAEPERPSRPMLRKLLAEMLLTDDDLNAFCIDFFIETYKLFAAGMTRIDKINHLLVGASPQQILDALKAAHPHRLDLAMNQPARL